MFAGEGIVMRKEVLHRGKSFTKGVENRSELGLYERREIEESEDCSNEKKNHGILDCDKVKRTRWGEDS